MVVIGKGVALVQLDVLQLERHVVVQLGVFARAQHEKESQTYHVSNAQVALVSIWFFIKIFEKFGDHQKWYGLDALGRRFFLPMGPKELLEL